MFLLKIHSSTSHFQVWSRMNWLVESIMDLVVDLWKNLSLSVDPKIHIFLKFSKLSFFASHLELLVQPDFHHGPRKSWRGSDQFNTSPTNVEAVKILFDACDGNLYFHGKNEMALSFNDRERLLWQGPQIQLVEEKFRWQTDWCITLWLMSWCWFQWNRTQIVIVWRTGAKEYLSLEIMFWGWVPRIYWWWIKDDLCFRRQKVSIKGLESDNTLTPSLPANPATEFF